MEEASNSPSTIAAYAFAIASALKERGVDPQAVFRQCGLSLQTTTDPMLRMTNREVSALFRESVKATGDPGFGLSVGNILHPGNLHAIGYALMASTSLRDFAQRLCNYYRIVSQSADIRIEETPDAFLLITAVTAGDICWETEDAYTALMVRFIRFIYCQSYNPIRLELRRPEPGEHQQAYSDYFQCDIS